MACVVVQLAELASRRTLPTSEQLLGIEACFFLSCCYSLRLAVCPLECSAQKTKSKNMGTCTAGTDRRNWAKHKEIGQHVAAFHHMEKGKKKRGK